MPLQLIAFDPNIGGPSFAPHTGINGHQLPRSILLYVQALTKNIASVKKRSGPQVNPMTYSPATVVLAPLITSS